MAFLRRFFQICLNYIIWFQLLWILRHHHHRHDDGDGDGDGDDDDEDDEL
jgi:hypothetical protein